MDFFFKKGEQDWNDAAYFEGDIEDVPHVMYRRGNYWQIAEANDDFMAGLTCDEWSGCTMTTDGFEYGFI